MTLGPYMDRLIKRNLTFTSNSQAALTHFVTTPKAGMTFITFSFSVFAENGNIFAQALPKSLHEEKIFRRLSESNFYEQAQFEFFFEELYVDTRPLF